MIGAFGGLLGITDVGGVVLGVGAIAATVAIVVDFAWRALVVASVFARGR